MCNLHLLRTLLEPSSKTAEQRRPPQILALQTREREREREKEIDREREREREPPFGNVPFCSLVKVHKQTGLPWTDAQIQVGDLKLADFFLTAPSLPNNKTAHISQFRVWAVQLPLKNMPHKMSQFACKTTNTQK